MSFSTWNSVLRELVILDIMMMVLRIREKPQKTQITGTLQRDTLIVWVAEFWCPFVAALAWAQRTLVHCVLRVTGTSTCSISFVDLLLFPLDGLGGMCGENSWNAFLLLCKALWVPISGTLRRAELMLWHAFLFVELRPVRYLFPPFPFLLGCFH
jgi:hypothetical protein